MITSILNRVLLAAFAALLFVSAASASTIYTYTGGALTCSSGSCPAAALTGISGTLTYTTELGANTPFSSQVPAAYDFLVNGQHFTTGGTLFNIQTDGNNPANIINWQIQLVLAGNLTLNIFTQGFNGFGGDSIQWNQGQPPLQFVASNSTEGTWKVGAPSPAVPEPSSILLLGSGALGVLGTLKKRYLR